MLTTIDNANDRVHVSSKSKTAGVWSTKVVPQPQTVSNYNEYMNAVERSDQILATNNVLRKCTRWWKTLFFHLIDTSPVQSTAKPAPPPLGEFETVHVPVLTKVKKRCVVCYKKTKADNRVYSYCSAPQCGKKYMYVTGGKELLCRVSHRGLS